MSNIILRRRKLGKTSTEGIVNFMQQPIEIIRNDKTIPPETDFVIRWGCTSNTNIQNTLNTARAIHQVGDKLGFRRLLEENDNNYAPKTWFNINDWRNERQNYPEIVIRPAVHAQGRNLLYYNSIINHDLSNVNNFIERFQEYYISQYIPKIAEYRVFVAQGRAVWVAQKTPSNSEDIAWNVARGGRFDNVRWDNWPLKTVRIAIEAFNLTELDFGGVDIMIDADNNSYVIEINSAPSQTSPYRQECVAKVFDYVIEYNKERIPLIERKGNYLKFIHPALNNRAYLI